MTLPPLYRGHNPALQMDKVELLTRAFKTKVWELSVIYSHA
jgi:hypothetical protein